MKIAILDDDVVICDLVGALLGESHHRVQPFRTGRDLMEALRHDSYDLILLEFMLPDLDGADVLAWVREHLDPAPPVIVLTAHTGEQAIVNALASGADDYVTKPIQEKVLSARVEAVLRRVYNSSARGRVEMYGRYTFHLSERSISLKERLIDVRAKEFALALLMFRNLNRALSRDYIMEIVWGKIPDGSSRTLDAHISQIRNRLLLRPQNGFRLSSVYGFGYRLDQLSPVTAEVNTADVCPPRALSRYVPGYGGSAQSPQA